MSEVTSAEEATGTALSFLKRYYYFAAPVSANKSDDKWEVRVNVGLVSEKIAKVEIDPSTGKIMAYELPIPPEKVV